MSAHKNWEIPAIETYFTREPDFTYSYLPVSAGIPSKSLQKWREYAIQMKAILPNFEVLGFVLTSLQLNTETIAHCWHKVTVLDMHESRETVVARVRVLQISCPAATTSSMKPIILNIELTRTRVCLLA